MTLEGGGKKTNMIISQTDICHLDLASEAYMASGISLRAAETINNILIETPHRAGSFFFFLPIGLCLVDNNRSIFPVYQVIF